MDFDAFKKLALTTLLGHQQDNGSWLNDPVTTIAAVEALCEECGGPDPVCRFSGLHAKLHPEDGQGGWLFPFSWGLLTDSDDPNAAYVAAVYHALRFGWSTLGYDDPIDQARAWVLSKWIRMNVLTDADYQLPISGAALARVATKEPWLLAQIGQANLHGNYYFDSIGQQLANRPDVVNLACELVQLMNTDHWQGQAITPEEATAITGAFLFHECTLYLCKHANCGVELTAVRDTALTWLLGRQLASGAWTGSPHVTMHCLKFIDTALVGLQPEHPHWSACIAALSQGIAYLLRPETQAKWTALGTYQQIDVLAVLIRLSKRSAPVGTAFESINVDGSVFAPDVFISYGGPDANFAKMLAKDFEAAGIRVWFAEWDLDYGDDVVEEIEKGLLATRKFVIVLSPEAIQRPWVRKELSAAFQQALSGPGKLIVPVMYRHCQPPPFLAAHRWVDFTQNEQYSERVRELVRRLKGKRPSRT